VLLRGYSMTSRIASVTPNAGGAASCSDGSGSDRGPPQFHHQTTQPFRGLRRAPQTRDVQHVKDAVGSYSLDAVSADVTFESKKRGEPRIRWFDVVSARGAQLGDEGRQANLAGL
jgi:hypothetical protein